MLNRDDLMKIFYLMEDLNDYFHQPMNYENLDDVEAFAAKIYPRIHEAYYRILWDALPDDLKKEVLDRP